MFINHDLHIHTHFSPCAEVSATAEHYIIKAKELGLNKIAFTDHMWDAAVPCTVSDYKKLTYEYISGIKDEVSRIDTTGVRVLYGCETELDKDGNIGVSEELAAKLDIFIVPQSHTHLTMPKELYTPYRKHADFMLNGFYHIVESPLKKYITTIAHPFAAVACPYDNREILRLISDKEFTDCFKAANKENIAIEINAGAFSSCSIGEISTDPMLHMLRLAKNAGCKFVFGSDSHNDKGHDRFFKNYVIATLLELTESDIADFAK